MINTLYAYGQTATSHVGYVAKKVLKVTKIAITNPVGSFLFAGALTSHAVKTALEFMEYKNRQLAGIERNSYIYDSAHKNIEWFKSVYPKSTNPILNEWSNQTIEAKGWYIEYHSKFENDHQGMEDVAIFGALALSAVMLATYHCCQRREKTPKEML